MILNRLPADRRAIHGSRFVCGRIVYGRIVHGRIVGGLGWLAAMRITPAANSPTQEA